MEITDQTEARKRMEYRIERDSMGEVRVPADRYWGAQTQRSHENFPIGVGIETMPTEIIRAFAVLKKAAAIANRELLPARMSAEKCAQIGRVCDEILAGELDGHFSLVVWQTGSGTQSNMNVNEVISGIMLNWIMLYTANMILANVKEPTSPYTIQMRSFGSAAVLPTLGLDKLFNDNTYVTLAIPLAIILAIVVDVVLNKTRFGYELRATGNNKFAAKYCGMAEKRNIILTLVIAGALSGLGASLLYQSGYEQWQVTASSVPAMGFNGIAATFLGGLNPIGTIFASFFIQHITSGGAYVDKTIYCSQISDLISAIIIYLCGFVLFMKYAMNTAIAKREEKAALAARAAEEVSAKQEGGDQ